MQPQELTVPNTTELPVPPSERFSGASMPLDIAKGAVHEGRLYSTTWYFSCMDLPLPWLKSTQEQSSISVLDIQRVRRQRRLAETEEEYSAVRSQLRDIAGGLRSRPVRNPKLMRIAGIVILVVGIVVGALLFYGAVSYTHLTLPTIYSV